GDGEGMEGVGGRRLVWDQGVHHIPAPSATIDIVADEDEAGRIWAAMGVAMLEQVDELGKAAMDVAHRVGQYAWHLQSPVRRDVNDHFVGISTAVATRVIVCVAGCQ